ncbi:MAG: FGGY family carbohydrate kinase [Armatimonadota bacterium]|nr:FGGY family carbohydrate kinase [Armatimonadota bacterium]
MPACLCGVDLGTTATKGILIREDGQVLAEGSEPSRLIQRGGGWVEQDPEEMVASVIRVVRSCVEQAKIRPEDVAGLCLDGQMAGLASVDREGLAATPYDSWLDTRCTPYVERMRSQAEKICALTGAAPTYSHGPKILWWMHERPEVFNRICKFVMPAGYVTMRLCGLRGEEAFIDSTYLHFSCLSDTEHGRWSEALCDHFGVPTDRLPRIVEPWEVVGRLSREAAEAMGLQSGTPVAAGAGDQAAAMLGSGVLEPGIAYDAAGTASVLALCVDRFTPDVRTGTLLCARMVPRGRWYLIGYIGGGGLNLRWWRDLVRQVGEPDRWDYPELDARAQAVPPGCHGLLFIPHLAGRVCPNQPELRGAWLGLTWTHGPEHLYRAMLESVAYEYSIYLEIARDRSGMERLQEVRVVGGGARSDLWNQIKCDVLGVPYARLNRTEAAALGSAILAGYAVGVFRDWQEAVGLFTWPVRRYTPHPEHHVRYRAAAAAYRAVVEDRAFWQRVAGSQP